MSECVCVCTFVDSYSFIKRVHPQRVGGSQVVQVLARHAEELGPIPHVAHMIRLEC